MLLYNSHSAYRLLPVKIARIYEAKIKADLVNGIVFGDERPGYEDMDTFVSGFLVRMVGLKKLAVKQKASLDHSCKHYAAEEPVPGKSKNMSKLRTG